MQVKSLNVQLFKLPAKIEIALFLISRELKSNHLINGLSKVGFDDSNCRSDLSALVFESIGFTSHSDDLYEFYFKLLDKYSDKIKIDRRKINKHAFNLYLELEIERRKRLEFQAIPLPT